MAFAPILEQVEEQNAHFAGEKTVRIYAADERRVLECFRQPQLERKHGEEIGTAKGLAQALVVKTAQEGRAKSRDDFVEDEPDIRAGWLGPATNLAKEIEGARVAR